MVGISVSVGSGVSVGIVVDVSVGGIDVSVGSTLSEGAAVGGADVWVGCGCDVEHDAIIITRQTKITCLNIRISSLKQFYNEKTDT